MVSFWGSCNYSFEVVGNSRVDVENDLCFCQSLCGVKGVVSVVPDVPCFIPQILDEIVYPHSSRDLCLKWFQVLVLNLCPVVGDQAHQVLKTEMLICPCVSKNLEESEHEEVPPGALYPNLVGFVGRYPRSKLGTTRVVNRAVLRGTNKRRTGMITQSKNQRKTGRHANKIQCLRSDEGPCMRPSPWSHFYLLI